MTAFKAWLVERYDDDFNTGPMLVLIEPGRCEFAKVQEVVCIPVHEFAESQEVASER